MPRLGVVLYRAAESEAVREALPRIAELHSACRPATCPERARLAAIPRAE